MSAKKMYKKVLILSKGFKLKHYRNNSLKQSSRTLLILVIFNIAGLHTMLANGPLNTYVSPAVKTVQFHRDGWPLDRKSTRLNSSHVRISYAVFCLKKKTKNDIIPT